MLSVTKGRAFALAAAVVAALAVGGSAVAARSDAPELHLAAGAGMTCVKSGERTSGLNKICYYDCAGSEETRTVGSAQLCPLNINSSAGGYTPRSTRAGCVKTGEYTSGLNKSCVYNCAGSERVMTVRAAQLCPMNP